MKPTNLKATLTFPSREAANLFTRAHSFRWFEGNTTSAVAADGSCKVTIYNVTDRKKEWIDSYVSSQNTK
jgi:hypothetical protein